MRILTLTTLFPNHQQPNLGIFIRHRIAALAKFAEVRVVAPIPWVPPFAFGEKARLFQRIEGEEQIDGFQVYHPRYLVIPRIGRSLYGKLYYCSLVRFIDQINESYPFDLLDVHWAYPDGYAGVLLGQRLGKPVSVSLRGSDIHTYPTCHRRRSLIAYTLSQANIIIAVSSSMVPLIEELGIDHGRVSVIPNGVDRKRFHYTGKYAARQALGVVTTDKVILAVGRLERPKRFDLLIQSVSHLMQHFDISMQLVIIGGGGLLASLVQLAKDMNVTERVQFVGELPNDKLPLWFSAADIFCLASDKEGCPNVILEALSSGTPVIASDVGNVKEMLNAPEKGLIVPDNTTSAWSKAIHSGISTDWNRLEIALSLEGKGWEGVGRTVAHVFRGVVEKYKPSKK